MFRQPFVSIATLDATYLRLDTTNRPLTGVLTGVNGSEAAPAFANSTNTGSGMYWDSSGNTILGTKGLSMMKVQSAPPRIFIGENAEAGIPQSLVYIEGESANLVLNRTIATESSIAMKVQGTGGGQLRGLIAGGFRVTDANAVVEIARFTVGTNGGLLVGTTTQDAVLRVQQKAGSTIKPMIIQANTGFRTVMYTSGRLALFQPSGATEGLATLVVPGGNNGSSNSTASIRLGRNSSSDTRQNHYISTNHSASNNDINAIRFWTFDKDGSGTASDFNNDCLIGATIANGKMAINSESVASNISFIVNGSQGSKVTRLDATTLTLDGTHNTICVDHTATAAVTITLPNAANVYDANNDIGITYIIKDTGANASVNNITINRSATNTIITNVTGATSKVLSTDGEVVRLTAISATEWMVH